MSEGRSQASRVQRNTTSSPSPTNIAGARGRTDPSTPAQAPAGRRRRVRDLTHFGEALAGRLLCFCRLLQAQRPKGMAPVVQEQGSVGGHRDQLLPEREEAELHL